VNERFVEGSEELVDDLVNERFVEGSEELVDDWLDELREVQEEVGDSADLDHKFVELNTRENTSKDMDERAAEGLN